MAEAAKINVRGHEVILIAGVRGVLFWGRPIGSNLLGYRFPVLVLQRE